MGDNVQATYTQRTLGGGWHWIHSNNDRGKHVPLVAPVLSLLIFVCYYTSPGPATEQSREVFSDFTYQGFAPMSPWYTVFSTFVSHGSSNHMLSNLVNMLLAGMLLELTEGSLRLLAITWGSQTLAMGLHGAFDDRVVVGASGSVYGFLWAQFALLLLNWGQMAKGKWRFLIMVALFTFDIGTWWFDMQPTAAVWAHLGGAVGSICVGVVLGVNVERLPWELVLNYAGAACYGMMCLAVIAREQWSAGLLALALLVFVLLPWCINESRLGRRMRMAVAAAVDAADWAMDAAVDAADRAMDAAVDAKDWAMDSVMPAQPAEPAAPQSPATRVQVIR